jgi:[acyl-carrier-protein] S-malonyltransferase
MKPAAEQLAAQLAGMSISVPAIPVINNVDVVAATDAAAIRDALVRQLYSPVRWVESVQKMAQEGVDTLVECGPGKVLVGLNKRIDKTMNAMAVFDAASLEKTLTELSA